MTGGARPTAVTGPPRNSGGGLLATRANALPRDQARGPLSPRHPIYDQLPMARSQLSSLPLPLPHLTIHPSRTGRHHRGPTDPKLAPGGSPFWNCDAPPAQQMTRATLPTPSISGPAIRRWARFACLLFSPAVSSSLDRNLAPGVGRAAVALDIHSLTRDSNRFLTWAVVGSWLCRVG